MPSAHLTLREEDIIRLSLEFLQNRALHITQLSLERESGIINGNYSDDALFLRQLILDGQWDDALEFVQPLQAMESFNSKKFHFLILKYKYFELLCIKAEAPDSANNEAAVAELVKVLEEVALYAPNKEAHSQLCLLLTTTQLHQHKLFKDWNPSSARVECWNQVLPLVEKYLSGERGSDNIGTPGSSAGDKNKTTAKNDRLVQLMIKGLLYESCVEYCQGQATGTASPSASPHLEFPPLLSLTTFSDSDLSLLSWLQSIPPETFACPFEQRSLNVDVERLDKPSLEASWTEQLLVTPIKPRIFPHSAMPYSRPKATDLMSRSLNPGMEGLAGFRSSMIASSGDMNIMSKSIASFHLTGKKTINTSVDRLFDSDHVFTGSAYGDLPTIIEKDLSSLNLSKDMNNLKDTTKRHSTDSLNKPPVSEKNSDFSESTKEDRTSPRAHSPAMHNSGAGGATGGGVNHHSLAHHQLHHNVSASQTNLSPSTVQQQMHPKQNVPLPPLPAQIPHSPQPYQPQQSYQPYHAPAQQFQRYNSPQQYNNNINSDVAREKTELYSIYQRRQLQNRPEVYGNANNAPVNANRPLMSGGLSVAAEDEC
ncbi:WD repeat-containing protein 47 [Hyalella azteca]|uniref:WD repeat-containing protein 47 n=1 Tax=Hyalella azteca TaxID=294128 RepID=A0A8B7N1C8_HYAAZ|nr:WD repeat-containing protein 47 [Hyalella azteca]